MGRGLLILVSGLVMLVGIVKMTMSDRLQELPDMTINYHQEMDAQNTANSLIEYGIEELKNNTNWRAGFSQNNFMGADVNLQVFDYTDFQNNNPNIPADNSIQNWNQYTVLLVSKVQNDRATAVTEVGLTMPSFSRFAYFTNVEPSGIYFYSSDTFNGPVHTNGQMQISGNPTFNGFVSSPNMWQGYSGSNNNNPQFNGGTNFNAGTIPMPTAGSLQPLRNQAANGGLNFNQDIRANFRNNGTVDISQPQGGGWGTPTNYDLSHYNGIISSSGKVFVQGTVNGRVTLHSSDEVRITGDIKYASDPRKNSNSNDLLGIVSEGNVTVAYGAENDSGNQDLQIDASILALGQFTVQYYWTGSPRGTLNLLGGVQQQQRGPVGTFNSGGIQSGYSKAYTYDQRLANTFPPAYPRTSSFAQLYWKEKPVKISSNY